MPKPAAAPTTSSPLNVESTEVRPKTRRRTFAVKDKLRILRAAEKCKVRGELGALLRQEGLYYATLQKWREQLADKGESGLSIPRGPKPIHTPESKELARLRREVEEQQQQIRKLQELLTLQKKVLALVDAAQKLVH